MNRDRKDEKTLTDLDVLGSCKETASFTSWAQKTAESYQLQLALALRLSAQAARADDPNFLEFKTCDRGTPSPSGSAEAVSHRFWVWHSLLCYRFASFSVSEFCQKLSFYFNIILLLSVSLVLSQFSGVYLYTLTWYNNFNRVVA